MKFQLTNTFEQNLGLFKAEAERIDAGCAKILFDNLTILCREGDVARDRAAISEFHRAVLQALDQIPETREDESR